MILIWVLAMIRRPSLRERLGEIAGLSAEAFQPVKDQLSPEGHVGIKTANLRANRAFVGTLRERIGELRFMRPDNAGQGSSASLASLALNSPDLANAVNLNNNASYGLQSSDPRARESEELSNAINLFSNTEAGGIGHRSNRSVWVRIFGDVFESESDDPNNRANSSSDALTAGLSVGVDQRLTEDWIAGVAVGYSATSYETSTNLEGDSDVKHGSVYAAYSNDKLYGDMMVTYGHISKPIKMNDGESVLIPQARISYNRELLGDDGGISATLGGVAANAVGAEQPKDTYRVGVGFTHLFSEASDSDSFFGHYEAEVTRDSTAHRITAGYRIKF